jgi:hypothetical protein
MTFDVDQFLDEPEGFDVDSFLDEPLKTSEKSNLSTFGKRIGHHGKAVAGGLLQQGSATGDVTLGALTSLAVEAEDDNFLQSTVKKGLAALNLIGSVGGYVPRSLMPWAYKEVDEKTKNIGEELSREGIAGLQNESYTFEDNSLGYHAANIAESFTLMIPALGAGYFSGGSAFTGLAAMAPVVYGEQFSKSKAEGRDNSQAAMDANFHTVTELVTEVGPFNTAFKAGQPLLNRLLKTSGLEGVGEVINSVFQRAYDAGVVNNETTTPEFLDLMTNDEALREYRDSLIAGAGMGAGMGLVGEVAQSRIPQPIEQIVDPEKGPGAAGKRVEPENIQNTVAGAESVDEAISILNQVIDSPVEAEIPEIAEGEIAPGYPDISERIREEATVLIKQPSSIKSPFDSATARRADDLSYSIEGLPLTEKGEGEINIPAKPRATFNKAELNSSIIKSAQDRLTTDTEFLADSRSSEAFSEQGFSRLNVPARREVMSRVISILHDGEIRDSIIRLIPVDVVDYLARQEITPEEFFHDDAMLQKVLTVRPDGSIPIGMKAAGGLVDITARAATARNRLDAFDGARAAIKTTLADRTDQISAIISGTHGVTPISDAVIDAAGAITPASLLSIAKKKPLESQLKQQIKAERPEAAERRAQAEEAEVPALLKDQAGLPTEILPETEEIPALLREQANGDLIAPEVKEELAAVPVEELKTQDSEITAEAKTQESLGMLKGWANKKYVIDAGLTGEAAHAKRAELDPIIRTAWEKEHPVEVEPIKEKVSRETLPEETDLERYAREEATFEDFSNVARGRYGKVKHQEMGDELRATWERINPDKAIEPIKVEPDEPKIKPAVKAKTPLPEKVLTKTQQRKAEAKTKRIEVPVKVNDETKMMRVGNPDSAVYAHVDDILGRIKQLNEVIVCLRG